MTKLKELLAEWKKNNDAKKKAEKNLVVIRKEIINSMTVNKMDVGNFHIVRKKNYGTRNRYKNMKENRFTWMLQITEWISRKSIDKGKT